MISSYQVKGIRDIFFETAWKVMSKKAPGQSEGIFIAYGFLKNINYLSAENFTAYLTKRFKKAGWNTEATDNPCSFILKQNGTKILVTVIIDGKGLKPDEIRLTYREA